MAMSHASRPAVENNDSAKGPSVEEVLQLAAQSYFGKVSGATDLALLTAGVVAPFRLVRAEEMVRAGVETATSIANFRLFETAYHTAIAEMKKFHRARNLGEPQLNDLAGYLESAFEEAIKIGAVPSGWCDMALRAIYSYATEGPHPIKAEVAKTLKRVVTEFRDLGKWREPTIR